MDKVNELTYDEWFKQVEEIINRYGINKKISKETHNLKQYWVDGENPAVIVRFMFPDYYQF